jgi:transposase InsO family protein
LDRWKEDYNHTRQHTSLTKLTPTEFRLSQPIIAKPRAIEKLAVELD